MDHEEELVSHRLESRRNGDQGWGMTKEATELECLGKDPETELPQTRVDATDAASG